MNGNNRIIFSIPTYIFSCPDKIHPKCCKLEFHFCSFWLGNHFVTFISDKTLIGAKISQTKINSSRLLKLCRSKPKKTFIQSAASYRFIFVHCGLEIILPPPGDSFYLDLSFSGRQIYTRPFRRQRYATRPNRRDAQRINISLFSLINVKIWGSQMIKSKKVNFSRPKQHFP